MENFGGNTSFETSGIKTNEGRDFHNEKRNNIEEEVANMYRSIEVEALRRVIDRWKFKGFSERDIN